MKSYRNGFCEHRIKKLDIIKVAVKRVARSRDASLRELSTYIKKPSSLKQINDTPSATLEETAEMEKDNHMDKDPMTWTP